jgi:hypothetical protein
MIHLHVGLGKCGSSSIQHFAAQQAEALRAVGLVYPILREGGPAHHMELGVVARQARARRGVRPVPLAMAKLREAMQADDGTSYLLSSESFLKHKEPRSRRNAEALRAFLGTARVQVLIYIREYPAWVESIYAQKTKRGENTLDMDGFVAHRCRPESVSVVEGVKPWVEVFGAENVRLRSLQRENLVGGDLILDLLEAMAIRTPMPPFKRVNESPPWTFLELAREIASGLPAARAEAEEDALPENGGDLAVRQWMQRLAIRGGLALQAAGLEPHRIQYMSRADWCGLRDLYNRDVAALNALLPGHVIPPSTTPEPAERGPAPSWRDVPEEIRQAYLGILAKPGLLKAMPASFAAAVRAVLKTERRRARRVAAA